MMFNAAADASRIHIQDQAPPRPSLRSRVSAFGAVLKPKRNAHLQDEFAPSAPQSECSTLVDFVIEDMLIKDDAIEYETEEYMLDADNSSWGTGKYTHSSLPKKSKRTRVSHSKLVSPSETQLLAEENTCWSAARPSAITKAENKPRSRFFATGSHRAQGKSGVEPEYLDPEDRAWM